MRLDKTGAPYAQDTGDRAKVHHLGSFGFVAWPEKYPERGKYTFIVTEGAGIFRIGNGGKPVDRMPTAEELKRWEKVE